MQRVHIGPDDPTDLRKIKEMISRRLSLFRTTLSHAHPMKATIKLKPDAKPFSAAERRRPPKEESALDEMVNKLRAQQIVEPAERSEWNALPLVLYKPDGSLRPAIDYRGLNLQCEKDTFPLPNVVSNLSALGRANWFTTVDLLQGFLQLELDDESKPLTTFTVGGRQWQYKRMPMGLTSSPGSFMRVVDAALRGLPPGIAYAYV